MNSKQPDPMESNIPDEEIPADTTTLKALEQGIPETISAPTAIQMTEYDNPTFVE